MTNTTYKEKFIAFLNCLEMNNAEELVEQDIEFITLLANQLSCQIKRRCSTVSLSIGTTN